ncbi:MAG: TIGR02099 family protein, partial [Ilumatobacteraceae bacterium]
MNDSPTPSRWLRALSLTAATLWWLLVALWLALALAWGALHGWIVPRVDDWRPTLEREASRVLGVPVRIGAISARSDALTTSFELSEVVLLDAQSREALRLPRVVVALSPRSLLDLGFEQLYIEGPELAVRRDTAGRLWVAGLDVSRGGGDQGQVADWFFRQKEVVVQGGTLRWIDEQRGAPPLALVDLRFVARNGARSHALRLDARPPADWGGAFTLMGQMHSPLLSQHPGRWQDWEGVLHADFAALDLARLRPYADVGVDLRSGQGRVRAWADLDRGRLMGGQADVDLRRVDALMVAGKPALALASLSG